MRDPAPQRARGLVRGPTSLAAAERGGKQLALLVRCADVEPAHQREEETQRTAAPAGTDERAAAGGRGDPALDRRATRRRRRSGPGRAKAERRLTLPARVCAIARMLICDCAACWLP